MHSKNLDQILYVPERYIADRRGDFFLLYDWDHHNWVVVNEHGKVIVDLIDGGISIGQIASQLSTKYGLETEVAMEKLLAFVQYLVESRFVFFNVDERDKVRAITPEKNRYSCSIIFQPCNLECVYCYNKLSRKDNLLSDKPQLTTDEFKRALDQLIEFGVERIMFSGGEPTLRDDLVELAEYIKSKNREIKVALITNGTRISAQDARTYSRLFDMIWVSLDSYNREEHDRLRGQGTFDRTTETIKLFVSENANLLVNAMISDFNYESIDKIRDFVLKELGAKKFRMSTYQPYKSGGHGEGELVLNPPPYVNESSKDSASFSPMLNVENDSSLESMLEGIDPLLKRDQCGIGEGEFALHSNGDIYPCQNLTDSAFICGNIREDRIEDVYHHSPIMTKCRNATVEVIEKCKTCEFKYVCAGGCRASAFEIYGKLDSHLEMYCEFNKRKALDRLWRNKMVPFQKVKEVKEKYEQSESEN